MSGPEAAARLALTTQSGNSEQPAPGGAAPGSLVAFVGILAIYLVSRVILFSDSSWFGPDDWSLIGTRDSMDRDALLGDHNQHWVSTSVLLFRVIYLTFGLNSYLPYMLAAALIVVGTASALRLVMRRSGVAPWTATAVAAAFPFLSPEGGRSLSNTLLLSSLLFGLAQLILIDHDGPWSTRDWLALVAGVATITSSGAGIPILFGVGLFALLRRGWLFSILQIPPLAVLFILWWSHYSPRHALWIPPSSFGPLVDWLRSTAVGAAGATGGTPVVTVLLLATTAAGVVAWSMSPSRRRRLTQALPALCLLPIPFAFALLTYVGRWLLGPTAAQDARYMALAVACLLPVLALAIDSLAKVHAAFLMAVALPWCAAAANTAALESGVPAQRSHAAAEQAATAASMTAAFELSLPDDGPANPGGGMGQGMGDTPIGFLRSAVAAGRLDPSNWDPTPQALAEARLRLSFYPESVENGSPPCTPTNRVREFRAHAGDRFIVNASPLSGLNPPQVLPMPNGFDPPIAVVLNPSETTTYRVLPERLDFRTHGTPEGADYLFCPRQAG